ncbi:substrate-binding domain-containing protein [Chthonobacter albigriseus]|uniref:LacI family DNA-binding transcriptional regulator n=1 Tax=Chthonobacter albigriseus TaxID=1683161 RepID=UPI0015EE74A5|nr:substrate-binding domain-containing protein [Chthonobacter albigriseus]
MTAVVRRKPTVNAQKVAEKAGVSRSAVSRTFTDGASVSPETRDKVLRAAAALGYHVNHLARGLIRNESGIVCLIASGIGTPLQAAMLDGLTLALQDAGRIAMVLNCAGDPVSVEHALRMTLNYRAEASVILSGSPPASIVTTCLDNGQRLVLLNRSEQIEGVGTVSIDNEGAARDAAAMLARAGCRRIAVVSSTAGTASLVAREEAFIREATKLGLETLPHRAGPTSYASGAASARALLAGADRPDAAFCVTDLLALGFMDAARHDLGLRIPEAFSVVGFDDIEQAGWASYELTTFRQPVSELVSCIMGQIGSSTEGVGPVPSRLVKAEPIWRRSVRVSPALKDA